jgi:aldehyde dehydrogenase (NAD+)
VQEATNKDVDIAVKAAREAFQGEWSKMKTSDRGRCLTKLADLIEDNALLLASVEALENGKSMKAARAELAISVGCLRYYGGWADKIHGKVIDTQSGTFNFTKHEPIGVCGQIIP